MISFKVSELMNYIKSITSKDYVLTRLNVEGEVSNFNKNISGTVYFSLKDEYSKISCVSYNFNKSEGIKDLKDGDLISALGRVSLYERDGSISLIVEKVEKVGLGKIYENFLKLKEELDSAGYFAAEFKKEIPDFSKNIGVITSPTGAAIRDILTIAQRRNPYVNLTLYPATVQGAYAKESLLKGLEYFSDKDIDVLIIGRGGGAYEDLDVFNDKDLALEVFKFPKPVISAVGHEIDYVILDFIADKRAATPSEAAEISIFSIYEYKNQIDSAKNRIESLIENKIKLEQNKLALNRNKLEKLTLDKIVDEKLYIYNSKLKNVYNKIIHKIDFNLQNLQNLNKQISLNNMSLKIEDLSRKNKSLFEKINRLVESKLDYQSKEILKLKSKIDKLDIKDMLSKGYSIVTDEFDNIVSDVKFVKTGDKINIILNNGEIFAEIISLKGDINEL